MAILLLAAPAALPQAPAAAPPNAFIRETYTKYEYRIPMRNGPARLFTSVYVPKDVFSDARTYAIMMVRTPYSVGPYGVDRFPNNLGPSELFSREIHLRLSGCPRPLYE